MNKFEERIAEAKKRSRRRAKKCGLEIKEGNGLTIGELISAVFSVKNKEDAKAFYKGYLEWLRGLPKLDGEPEHIARRNIGWCFGEGMAPDKIKMWSEACEAVHPIFGISMPTPQEALKVGIEAGRKTRTAKEAKNES